MPKNSAAPDVTLPSFIKGQLWKFGERCIRIEHVGKLLVEHRGISLDHKRPGSKRMVGIRELQQFLKANDAVLMVNSLAH